MLAYIACTVPWLKFLLSQLFASVVAAVGNNTAYLRKISQDFRRMLKEAKSLKPTHKSTFVASKTVTHVHSSPRPNFINTTLRAEIDLLVATLRLPEVRFSTLIGHLVRREPSARTWSNS